MTRGKKNEKKYISIERIIRKWKQRKADLQDAKKNRKTIQQRKIDRDKIDM